MAEIKIEHILGFYLSSHSSCIVSYSLLSREVEKLQRASMFLLAIFPYH